MQKAVVCDVNNGLLQIQVTNAGFVTLKQRIKPS